MSESTLPFPYKEEKLGGLGLTFFTDAKPECHHCGNRTSRVMVADEGWVPRRFVICHKCFKAEMEAPGSILSRYKPSFAGKGHEYSTDMKTVWDAETGRARRGKFGEVDVDAKKYGLDDFKSRSYYTELTDANRALKAAPKQKFVDKTSACGYCDTETVSTGVNADGKTVPMCRVHRREHNTVVDITGKMDAPRYTKLWWRINHEAVARDKGVCHLCGGTSKWADYILLPKDGGIWAEGNVAATCWKCSNARGSLWKKSG